MPAGAGEHGFAAARPVNSMPPASVNVRSPSLILKSNEAYRAGDLRGREMDIELIVIAVCIPLCLRQSKWSDLSAFAVVRNTGSQLCDSQDVVRLDAENDALADAFLGKFRAIDSHVQSLIVRLLI
jgi:hypothetical protein